MSEPKIERKASGTHSRPPIPSPSLRKSNGAQLSNAGILRQRLGNQGAQTFVARAIARSAEPGVATTSQATAGQLSISQPRDAHEREADRMADIVMRMPAQASAGSNYAGLTRAAAGAVVQRVCADCEEESKTPKVQRKEGAAEAPQVTSAVAANVSALRGGGSPMPASTRNYFEPRFGADFSQVRLHTDTRAADTAKSINAKAFTVGRDIAFSEGQYAPESSEGQRLLAHELTHVVQQEGRAAVVQREKPGGKDESKATKKDPVDLSEVRKELAKIEANWNLIANVAGGSALAADWVKRGDEVMTLIREHTAKAMEAIQQNDSTLSKGFRSLLITDLIAYQYVSWHAFLYQNLNRVEPWVAGLAKAFKADNRAFTGRKKAEEAVDALRKLVEVERKRSAPLLAKVKTNVTFKIQNGSGKDIAVMLTSAGDKNYRQAMQDETASIKKAAAGVEGSVEYVNQFLDGAFDEGLVQAGEAVLEFYVTKGALQKDKQKKKDTSAETAPEPEVGPIPMPYPEPDERKKRRKKCKDICEDTLPIKWPSIMPLPPPQRPLIRTPSGDAYIEPDKRSKPQRDLQKEITEQHERHRSGKPGAYVPRPCFKHDADPNDLYDAHHMHPLYLGGAEDEINLCALRRDHHQRAHPALNDQKVMFSTHPVWINCKVCSAHLPDHLALQEYEIFGGTTVKTKTKP